MQTFAVSMAEPFDVPCPSGRDSQDARIRLGLDVDHLVAHGALVLRVDPVAASKSN